MKLAEYIDNELHKGLHDIIYLDGYNNEIHVNPDNIEFDERIEVYYQKIAIIKINKT
jgi:hypothetical protein